MNKSARSDARLVPSHAYPDSLPGEAQRMIAPATATSIKPWHDELTTLGASDVQAAWSVAPRAVRGATVCAIVLAVSAPASSDVSVASGLTVAVLVAAALVDWHRRRLPNIIVFAALAVFAIASTASFTLGADVSLAGIGLGVAVFAGPLLFMHLASPQSMGFGDVKMAVVLGMSIGAVDWHLSAWALTVTAGATAIVGATRRRSTLPLGPGLVAGALSTILAAAVFDLSWAS